MKKKTLIIFLLLAPLFAVTLAGMQVYYNLAIWEYTGQERTFIVNPGEPFSKINYRLKKEKLISNSRIFHRYSSFKKVLSKFKAGEYVIETNSTMLEIVDTLVSGKSKTISITIPEGKNLYEIGKRLEQKKITTYKNFVAAAKDTTFVHSLNITAQTAEGYLFPETYNFTKNSKAKNIIRAMVNQFKQQTKKMDFTQGGLTPHQIVILSSIVEKETGASWERPKIAGVFLNRLAKPMRLQSDPTTIYGIYEKFNGNLRKKDLQTKTAYNTYRMAGLPQGPICNPGLKALEAVIKPEKHKFLYFVSMNDGTHVFSRKYSDHVRAVNKYQKQKRYRKGRSWRDLKNKKRQ